MVYGFLFVPLTLVVLRDLGQWALVHTTKIYARLLIMFRRARGFEETKDDELINLPIKFCMGIMLGYLLFASLFIYEYDALSGPPDSGMDFFHSFYFSFISMTTIGLGDIMPNNVTFAPIITVLFFFGMPILKVVNRSTYICVENGVFGTMTVLENRLDTCWTGVPPNDAEAQPVSPRPSIRSHSILKHLPRSVSESENNDDRESQRSILRNPHLAKIRPILEKRQSFDLQLERPMNDSITEADVFKVAQIWTRCAGFVSGGIRCRSHPGGVDNLGWLCRDRIFEREKVCSVLTWALLYLEFSDFGKSFYWVAANHKKIGFRHICMLLLVLVYTLLGALLFYLIESNYERNTVVIRKSALDKTILEIATEMTNKVNDPDETVNVTMMEDYIKVSYGNVREQLCLLFYYNSRAYVTLLTQESAYKGSTFYKSDDPDNNYKWTFGSAFFFSMNVYTTTGYGKALIYCDSSFADISMYLCWLCFVFFDDVAVAVILLKTD
ncbi:Ion channel [Oesophagostomum dentatum]|uniref:Ion channel n=2 Tax=Oesophagostomum dentatum TaxID=61180 RepID=A0A0B1TIY2_OESDE|nr:Ion channel [Oesophagostomum dentatum]